MACLTLISRILPRRFNTVPKGSYDSYHSISPRLKHCHDRCVQKNQASRLSLQLTYKQTTTRQTDRRSVLFINNLKRDFKWPEFEAGQEYGRSRREGLCCTQEPAARWNQDFGVDSEEVEISADFHCDPSCNQQCVCQRLCFHSM